MTVPKEAIALVKGFEGFSHFPYLCPALVWTIGYGSTRDEQGRAVTRDTPGVTEPQAVMMAYRDLERFHAAVLRLLPGVTLNDPQAAVLVDFTYNLGAGAFQGSTLRQCVLRGDFEDVPDQLQRWVRGGGKVLPGLVRRRKAEALLWQQSLA